MMSLCCRKHILRSGILILLADQPFVGPILKNLGHWLGVQTLAEDKDVSEERLPLKEVILSAAHGDLSCWAIVPIAGSFIHLILNWIVDILFLQGQLYASFGSNLRLCLVIEIIFTHLSMDISDF